MLLGRVVSSSATRRAGRRTRSLHSLAKLYTNTVRYGWNYTLDRWRCDLIIRKNRIWRRRRFSAIYVNTYPYPWQIEIFKARARSSAAAGTNFNQRALFRECRVLRPWYCPPELLAIALESAVEISQ